MSDKLLNRNDTKRKKRTKKGILGVPKKSKILFIVNKDTTDSESEDDSPDYIPDYLEAKRKILPNKKNSQPDLTRKLSQSISLNWSHDIPYEILLKIFTYHAIYAHGDLNKLKILEDVCHYWKNVANDPKLCTIINLSSTLRTDNLNQNKPVEAAKFDKKINKFLQSAIKSDKFKFCKNLNLSNLYHLTNDHLSKVLKACNTTCLTRLNLSQCKKIQKGDSSSYEKLIIENCCNLTCLNLSGMKKQLNQTYMKQLFETLNTNLKYLNISQNVMSPSLLKDLTEHCTSLETIDISNTEIKGVLQFDSQTFPKSLKCLQMLQTYPKTKYSSITSVLTSESFLENLEIFSICFNSEQYSTNNMIFIIAKICKDALHLKSIDIRKFKSSLDDRINIFQLINSNKVAFLYLSYSKLSESDGQYLTFAIKEKWTKSLIELDLSWSNISLQYLRIILESFCSKNGCKISKLNLAGTCVETQMIRSFISKNESISSINLTSCRSVERGLKKILTKQEIADFI